MHTLVNSAGTHAHTEDRSQCSLFAAQFQTHPVIFFPRAFTQMMRADDCSVSAGLANLVL